MGGHGTGPLAGARHAASGGLLSIVHVLLNRSHPHLASALAAPLAHSGRTLRTARARALRERIALESATAAPDRTAWGEAVESLLDALDDALAHAGGVAPDALVEGTVEALTLAYHPLLHQGALPSPLLDDPEGFVRAWDSRPLTRLLRGAPRTQEDDRDAGDTRRVAGAHRLLVLTDTNLTFMGDILDHWRGERGIELRVRDLAAEGVDPSWWSLRSTVGDRLASRDPGVPSFLEADLAWADTVWVEWGGALAARLSGVDLDARLVVRLHRYEAFTAYPLLTRWEGVCDLVLVSDLVSRALTRAVPGIERRTRIRVVPNAQDLRRYDVGKREDAAHTLALIGWDRPVKDPDWALDVLDLLHARDPRWRLLLVGDTPAPGGDAATRRWSADLAARVHSLGSAVVRTGFRGDVPEVLRGASVIVSSSLSESAHLALQQGVASGCLPVVRDWPGMRVLGGPRALYPDSWVVRTPDEGARRILDAADHSRDGRLGPAASPQARVARDWVLDRCDSSRVWPLLDGVLGKVPQ